MQEDDGLPLERGIGPIQLGSQTDPPLDEGFLDPAGAVVIKVERVIMAVIFLAMLGLCMYNAFFYLYKARMYRSYPLIFVYLIVAMFSFMGITYEFYMGFNCGDQDCFTHLLIAIMPEYSREYRQEEHQNYLHQISVLWKIRQQLTWGLGISQLLVIGTLAIKIMSIEYSLQIQTQAQVMQERMSKADKRSKWLSVCMTTFYSVIALSIVILSFPIMNIINQDYYNAFFLAQLIITSLGLLSLLLFLLKKISKLNQLSNDSMSDESSALTHWVLLQVSSYFLRIVLTVLQIAEVYTYPQLRQFWAVQLEMLVCLVIEVAPPFYFLRMHLKNNSQLKATRSGKNENDTTRQRIMSAATFTSGGSANTQVLHVNRVLTSEHTSSAGDNHSTINTKSKNETNSLIDNFNYQQPIQKELLSRQITADQTAMLMGDARASVQLSIPQYFEIEKHCGAGQDMRKSNRILFHLSFSQLLLNEAAAAPIFEASETSKFIPLVVQTVGTSQIGSLLRPPTRDRSSKKSSLMLQSNPESNFTSNPSIQADQHQSSNLQDSVIGVTPAFPNEQIDRLVQTASDTNDSFSGKLPENQAKGTDLGKSFASVIKGKESQSEVIPLNPRLQSATRLQQSFQTNSDFSEEVKNGHSSRKVGQNDKGVRMDSKDLQEELSEKLL